MTDLLPCPFCGQDQAFPCFLYATDDRRLWHVDIECAHCEAKIGERITFAEYAKLGQSEAGAQLRELAAKAWNTRAADGWQGIETAPKDGTPFLTFSQHAAANPCTGVLGTQSTSMLVMCWLASDAEPYPVDEHGDWHEFHCYQPTHWRPLPPPPQEQKG